MIFLKRLWEGWKKVARKIGDFQARLLMGIFYFFILGPVALLMNWRKDVLSIRAGSHPGWRVREPDKVSPIEKATRQS